MIFHVQTIPQASQRVKFKCGQIASILLCGLMTFSGVAQALQIQASELASVPFEPHPNYLSMSLKTEPAAKARKELENQQKLTLKNRGEAHITVITPPEFEILKTHVSIQDIDQIAKKRDIQHSDLKIRCVGKGETKDHLATYFLVVASKNLLHIRQDVEKIYKVRGGKGDFQSAHFYPHITLGFTARDLHEADGVIKDERSCISDLSSR
jgi:2'-5' RNA ligase